MKNIGTTLFCCFLTLILCLIIGRWFYIRSAKPAPTSDTTHLLKQLIPVHDTLVIIQTYDTLPRPKIDSTDPYGIMVWNGGWTTSPIELFKDSKTIDTIRRHEIIYR